VGDGHGVLNVGLRHALSAIARALEVRGIRMPGSPSRWQRVHVARRWQFTSHYFRVSLKSNLQ
jgi:hypothetical protein